MQFDGTHMLVKWSGFLQLHMMMQYISVLKTGAILACIILIRQHQTYVWSYSAFWTHVHFVLALTGSILMSTLLLFFISTVLCITYSWVLGSKTKLCSCRCCVCSYFFILCQVLLHLYPKANIIFSVTVSLHYLWLPTS